MLYFNIILFRLLDFLFQVNVCLWIKNLNDDHPWNLKVGCNPMHLKFEIQYESLKLMWFFPYLSCFKNKALNWSWKVWCHWFFPKSMMTGSLSDLLKLVSFDFSSYWKTFHKNIAIYKHPSINRYVFSTT